MPTNKYVYFLYSEDQFKEKNKILSATRKEFNSGTVVVNGVRKKFTQLSDKASLPRFIDTKIIAEGYLEQFTYTLPTNTSKKGN